MRKEICLIITDEEIIVYKGSVKKIYTFNDGTEHIQAELKHFLSLTPKVPLYLLIDRIHQDVREEQLPPLSPWDKLRFLSHKREEWMSQGIFHDYQFFKQDKKSFLQWVCIAKNDSLISWFSWIKSLSNPFGSVSFVSLEAGRFLKKHFPASQGYNMLIYQMGPHKTRYAIFKHKRLLLFRPWSGEEDMRRSLHFLSRTYPDIHEKLQILNLIGNISLSFPYVTTLADPQAFINFLIFQKGGTPILKIIPSLHCQWLKIGTALIFISFIVLSCVTLYQALLYKHKLKTLFSNLDTVKKQIQHHKILLKNQDIVFLRSALNHYGYLTSQIRDPFITFKKLSIVLKKHQLQLESLLWNYEQTVSLEMSFFMKNHNNTSLVHQFNALLDSLTKAFPTSHIQIIEGPFQSSGHETYKYPTTSSLPMARIRIELP